MIGIKIILQKTTRGRNNFRISCRQPVLVESVIDIKFLKLRSALRNSRAPIARCNCTEWPVSSFKQPDPHLVAVIIRVLPQQRSVPIKFHIDTKCFYLYSIKQVTQNLSNSSVPQSLLYRNTQTFTAIILVTTLSSRGRAFTSSENHTNHSCFYNVV